MQNPYAPPSPPRKSGLPGYVWALIACGSGCGCLALIAFFAAILFPVFAQARLKARQVACLSHVAEMARAAQLYAEDHNEVYPASNAWMDSLTPYIGKSQKVSTISTTTVFHCPSVAAEGYGYAYNSLMSQKALADISKPNEIIMLYDSSDLARNASDPVTSLPSPPRHIGNNIGFVDGHVRSLRSRPPGGTPPAGNG
jgi:prepilin-type processing-associated H-X9-DG protein